MEDIPVRAIGAEGADRVVVQLNQGSVLESRTLQSQGLPPGAGADLDASEAGERLVAAVIWRNHLGVLSLTCRWQLHMTGSLPPLAAASRGKLP
ncbi:hypothetical protein [Streptomyces sp. NBC_01643]|uniref:hypothetical protein n=1 Tax=Streptomyces sp. NBC_01643 TaxID=2975906 RepID=UPI0038671C7F|nr:hypothetical protein OHB03_16305 [Streptomyces sp. NBC_01643]